MVTFELKRFLRILPRRWLWLATYLLILAGGGGIVLLLAHVVTWETSFDTWLEDFREVRRIEVQLLPPGGKQMDIPLTMPALAPLLNAKAADLGVPLRAARLSQPVRKQARWGDRKALLPVSFADAEVATVLGLPSPLSGLSVEEALSRGFAVLTQDAYTEIAGAADRAKNGPRIDIDASVEIEDLGAFRIGCILAPLPPNTHLRMGVILPMERKPSVALTVSQREWMAFDLYTYVRRTGETSWEEIRHFISSLIDRYSPRFSTSGEQGRIGLRLVLRPLPDIHLNSVGPGQMRPPGNSDLVHLYRGYAGLVAATLVLGAFMAASLYELAGRLEWGIRRLVGAARRQVLLHRLGEHVLLVVGAMVLATPFYRMGVVVVARSLYGGELPRCSALLCDLSASMWISTLGGGVLAALLAVVMATIVLRAPLTALIRRAADRAIRLFRAGLVAAQTALCAFVLVGGTVATLQLGELLRLDRGFAWEGRVAFESGASAVRARAIASRLKEYPQVVRTALVGGDLPRHGHARVPVVLTAAQSEGVPVESDVIPASPEFAAVMGLDLLAGRWFSDDPADVLRIGEDGQATGRAVVDETLARALGFGRPREALGQMIASTDLVGAQGPLTQSLEIIGVVRAARLGKLDAPAPPTYFVNDPDRLGTVVAQLRGPVTGALLTQLDDALRAGGGEPVHVKSLDSAYGAQLERWRQKRRMFLLLSAAVLVLVAGATFASVSGRLKEDRRKIGLHRLFGAGTVVLLARYAGRQIVALWPAIIVGILFGYMQRDWIVGRISSQVEANAIMMLAVFAFISLFVFSVVAGTVLATLREPIASSLRDE